MSWSIAIDRGGTFTDCIGQDGETGELRVVKVLSSDQAPISGIRQLLGLADGDPIPPCDVRMGTTVATNALLTRSGRRCALVITEGFGDILSIGDQSRPDIFALSIRRPAPLPDEVVEVEGRAAADGTVLRRTDLRQLRGRLTDLRRRGIDSVAIVIMHGYRARELEDEVKATARELGIKNAVASHEVAAELGLLARADTTVVDAYLTPLLQHYLAALTDRLPGSTIRMMQSSGGLTGTGRFRGKDAILSGPAGGVVATARIAESLGLASTIGFDMGGTSTDVCRYGGELERTYEARVAGVRIRTPMMAIHTVAAGGGSICRYDGHRFTVGPESVGADPGPLCYGAANARDLSLTDVNLVLGRIVPDRFPIPLRRGRVDRALAQIHNRLHNRLDGPGGLQSVAEGFFRVAVENMAQAIRNVTVARGHDVRQHAMVVFGGAGGQHACAVARRIGIHTLLLHPLAGVLSAHGIAAADVTWHGEADAGRRLLSEATLTTLESVFHSLQEAAEDALWEDGFTPGDIEITRRLDLRYRGTETSLTLEAKPSDTLRAEFDLQHGREYGYARQQHPIEVVTARVEAVAHPEAPSSAEHRRGAGPAYPRGVHRFWCDGAWRTAPIFHREDFPASFITRGPAVVLEETGTIVVDPGWELMVDPEGLIVLSDLAGSDKGDVSATVDPVTLEIMSARFMAIATQMGTVLQRTALSTNIRERLDFSCALFDRDANLVANAPHVPVHLGAMGESVAAIARDHPDPRPGDVFATNDPAAGGSHLPDITVVTPVFRDGTLSFYTASRGHHADIGGTTPGSMPPDSTSLAEEGVVFEGVRIVSDGSLHENAIYERLLSGKYPARRPEENVADLLAQVAANQIGARRLEELCDECGYDVVNSYMHHVQDHGTACVREAIAALPRGTRTFVDATDDGVEIAVTLSVQRSKLTIDFGGTSPAVRHNFNAPRAVTVAAVLYVLRSLVGEPIPLNAGCLRPVQLKIPHGSLLDPGAGAAVAGGNVETAQRIVDVLLAALGRKAASQGTMNNLTFGDGSFGYYETIGGGEGATRDHDGASGVHTHMTNTRITDPEVLEARFPVRLLRFALRRHSGGTGRRRGGDGLIREIEFLDHLRVSILSDRRANPAYGLQGGGAGLPGRNLLDGEPLPARCSVQVAPGQRLVVATPGGGGFGALPQPSPLL